MTIDKFNHIFTIYIFLCISLRLKVTHKKNERYVLQSVGLDDNNTHLSAIQYLHALLHTYILHILDTFHGVDNNRKRYDDDVRFGFEGG